MTIITIIPLIHMNIILKSNDYLLSGPIVKLLKTKPVMLMNKTGNVKSSIVRNDCDNNNKDARAVTN